MDAKFSNVSSILYSFASYILWASNVLIGVPFASAVDSLYQYSYMMDSAV